MHSKSWETEPTLDASKKARVFSPSNIALAKYWGKRDVALNLPTNGSLSITLKDYGSFTTVEFDQNFSVDRIILNGKDESAKALGKVKRVLDELRAAAGVATLARVQSYNNFPTGAGLASSASGLSAVALAGSTALGLTFSRTQLSEIARKGSGSACRSLFSGFVEWKQGDLADGSDSVAEEVAPVSHWPLKVIIGVVNAAQKNQASTGGMEQTRQTSPYFEAWVENAQRQLPEVRAAIQSRDFGALAALSESNCIQMHASAMAAVPPVFYWQPTTIDIMHRIWNLRRDGVRAFFTIDAGPNVVVVCEPSFASRISSELARIPGLNVLSTEIGEGARLFDAKEWQGE